MGLFEQAARVTTIFTADTSDMKAGLKGLTGAERELQAAQIEAAESRNKGLEDWKTGLEHTVIALAAVGEAAHLMFEGYQEGIKEARLETAAMGTDIEGLSKAAGGLQTHMQLLEFAAKVQTSAFGATNEQMEVAERFMRQLEARGVPTADAYNAVTEAITTGRVKGLIPYGIVVNTHLDDLSKLGEENLTLAQKSELVTGAYKAMADATSGVVDGNDNVGDSMKRTAVSLQDSFAEFKKSLGELAVAFQPVIEAVTELLKGITAIINATSEEWGASTDPVAVARKMIYGGQSGGLMGVGTRGRLGGATQETAFDRAMAGYKTYNQGLAIDAGKEFQFGDDRVDSWKPTEAQKYAMAVARKQLFDSLMAPVIAAANAQGNVSSGLNGQAAASMRELLGGAYAGRTGLGASADTGDLSTQSLGFGGSSFGPLQLTSYGTGQGSEEESINKIRRQGDAYNKMLADTDKNYDAWNHKHTESLLSKTFGPVGEFDLYKKGFEALSGAVGSAYDAWVSGSESAGVAFKKFVGQSVEAVGKQMAIEAIKEGAYALGSLAFGDMAGAASHGAAAAEFAAGAVIAGVVAHELGGGSSSASGGGSSGSHGSPAPGISGPGGGGQQQGNGPIIVIGSSFGRETPRMQQLDARRVVHLALGGSGVEDS